jgi:hypothetical protein
MIDFCTHETSPSSYPAISMAENFLSAVALAAILAFWL